MILYDGKMRIKIADSLKVSKEHVRYIAHDNLFLAKMSCEFTTY